MNTIEWYSMTGKLIRKWEHTQPCWVMNDELTFEDENGHHVTITMKNSNVCWIKEEKEE